MADHRVILRQESLDRRAGEGKGSGGRRGGDEGPQRGETDRAEAEGSGSPDEDDDRTGERRRAVRPVIGGAKGGTRTPTVLLPPAPQAGASANSATFARVRLLTSSAARVPGSAPASRRLALTVVRASAPRAQMVPPGSEPQVPACPEPVARPERAPG